MIKKFPSVWKQNVRKPQGGFFWLTLYTVPQKTRKIIFVIITSNFHQIWQFLSQWWQIV